MRLVFLGPPGAGKGTQAKVVSERLRIPHISTGEMLREGVRNSSEVGRQANDYMDKGMLVPDEIVTKIVVERLTRPDAAAGFILDGFPRTKKQAVALEEELKAQGSGLDYVVNFDTSEHMIIARLSGRRVCSSCGAIYHIVNMKPKTDSVCDTCGSALYQRVDDKVDTIKKRLDVYLRQTADLIDYYKSRGLLRTVSGDLSVEEVFDELAKFLNRKDPAK